MDSQTADKEFHTATQPAESTLDPSLKNHPPAKDAPKFEFPSSLHKKTDLVYSKVLSERTGHDISIKLDALQPSGSFKIRGIGHVCKLAVDKYGPSAHLVSSSGGNAGLAAATAAKALSVKCTVYVPGSAEESIKETLRGLGAEVMTVGAVWDDCDAAARKAVDEEEGAVYVHPFEGEDLVEGHSSVVEEIYDQMGADDKKPDMIVAAVGGGGFLNGIFQGLSNVQKKAGSSFSPPLVVSVQDFGADGFSQSMNAYYEDPIGNAKAHITLPGITSLATSMGARKCSALTLENARRYAKYGSIDPTLSLESEAESSGRYFSSVVVEDAISGSAAWQFNKDFRIMVELACGAALSPAYQHERILNKLVEGLRSQGEGKKNVVLIACGGSKINEEMLEKYEKTYGEQKGTGRIEINGVGV